MIVNYDMIRKRRKELNLTGEKLGELIGVSKQTVSKYENGTVNISNKTLMKICKVLEIDPNEFYGIGTNYNTNTIAAHHDDEEWTEDELIEIEQFKEFVRSKRK